MVETELGTELGFKEFLEANPDITLAQNFAAGTRVETAGNKVGSQSYFSIGWKIYKKSKRTWKKLYPPKVSRTETDVEKGIQMGATGVAPPARPRAGGQQIQPPARGQQIQLGHIYVAKKRTIDGHKIVLVWCWGIRSQGTLTGIRSNVTWTKFISIFLPQLESDEQLPKNLTPGGRKWMDARDTITLLPAENPTAFDVGKLVLGPRNGLNYYNEFLGRRPSVWHNNTITWKDPNNTLHNPLRDIETVELLKSFNENRFEVLELDSKSTRDILLLTKLRLERLISIGIAFNQNNLTTGAAARMATSLRSATRGFMSAEPNYEPVLYKPFNVYANENVNDAVRFTELLECVDDVCKVISHRTGALVSEMESTHLEENKIDKILWCCCNSCKRGHDIQFCTSRKPFLHIWYIIMAAGIAAAGLGTNSAPVVVASMLVSSMMEPIKGLATATRCQGTDLKKCSRNSKRFFAHFVLLMCDVGLCLLVGYIAGLIFSISSENWNDYTLTEQLSGTAGISQRYRSISLPQEIYGRGEVSGLVVAVVVALLSTFALITADKADNKSALVGIGISASLLPPIVNAGLLFGMHDRGYVAYIGNGKSEQNLQKRGGISLALAFINIGIIVVIWTMGFLCQKSSDKNKWCRNAVAGAGAAVAGAVGGGAVGGGAVGGGAVAVAGVGGGAVGGGKEEEADERSSLLRF